MSRYHQAVLRFRRTAALRGSWIASHKGHAVEIEWYLVDWLLVNSHTFRLLDDGDLKGTLKLKQDTSSPFERFYSPVNGVLRGRVAGDPFRAKVAMVWKKEKGSKGEWTIQIEATVAGSPLSCQWENRGGSAKPPTSLPDPWRAWREKYPGR